MYEMLFSFLHDYLLQRWENLPTLLSPVIGLDEMVDKVLKNLQNNNLYILAVVGIGRIGKTTLVKKLYYQIQGEFQKFIFWENVKSIVV
jgi:predicted AAA+ superfamily ATPase